MGRSQYPRCGHRLAPATLRELLLVPLPDRYAGLAAAGGMLCDLDETAWKRFGDDACRDLAEEILRTISRAARMPMAIAHRTLPAIPPGMSVSDLELEVRTINCLVRAGLHKRSQDLPAMTVESILGLRGFWVKCLVDLLTSLEHAIDHPQVRKLSREGDERMAVPARTRGRYPRFGQRLAPSLLGEVLAVPIPESLVVGTPAEGMLLCELDETVWERLSPELIARLAAAVIGRVNAAAWGRAFRKRRFPQMPPGFRFEDLRLENRTYNCLKKSGWVRSPEKLAERTLGDLLAVRAFGAKCLVDLLSALETLNARAGKLDERLTAEAERLAALSESSGIHFSDPRLGDLLRAIDHEANTVAELAARIQGRKIDPADPLRQAGELAAIRRRIESLKDLTLEQELIEIFAPGDGSRDRRIINEYYGWDGHGSRTLEDLSRKYGLSRERIRQICIRVMKRGCGAGAFAPVLDRALAFIAQRLPAPVERLQEEFHGAGFSACKLPLEKVRQAALFLHREPGFVLVSAGECRLAVRPEWAQMPRLILQAARRAALQYGTARIRDIMKQVSARFGCNVADAVVLPTLQTAADFRWLDEKSGWFHWEHSSQHGLGNMVQKVLAVAGKINVRRLRAALSRYRRNSRRVPPARVLLEFCRHMPHVRIQGQIVIGNPPRDDGEILSGVEAAIVRVLDEHGPIMKRRQLEEQCVAGGMNRFSFNATLASSPIIAQHARSKYGLIGARPGSCHDGVPALSQGDSLQCYGRTDGGQIYLSCRLSKAAISDEAMTVPAAMKARLDGTFALRTPDGGTAGALVSKSGRLWGLKRALRSRRARPGDRLWIVFDPCTREVTLRIGEDGPLRPSVSRG